MRKDQAAAAFAALGNPTRLDVYKWLVKAGDEGMNVGALQEQVGAAPSTMAHHLHTLTVVGLVRREKRGREIINFAAYEQMTALTQFLTSECCVGVKLVKTKSAA